MKRNYGWRPDLPDKRDHLFSAKRRVVLAQLPAKVDLRAGCSPVEDQGQLGSCTANAIIGCLEFLEIKNTNTFTDLSRLFLYYYERVLIHTVDSDSGAVIRDGIKILAKLGCPHEMSWPYIELKFKVKPPVSLLPEAKKHLIRDYQRLDTVDEMRSCLAMGYPFVFGFSVYDYFESSEMARTGIAKMPSENERVVGGHAVTAVGYDDMKQQFIVRNSWGSQWGQQGYFMMPYAYMADRNLSDDYWTIRR